MKNNSIGERESKIIVLTPLQEDLDIHFNIKQNVVIESVYVDEKNTRYICKKHKISNVLFFPDCAVSLDLILKNLRWFKKQNISMLNNYHYNIKYIKDISQMRSILEINNYIKKKWSIDTFIAQENILNHKRKYKSFFLLNNENFCLIGMLGTKQVTQSKHNIVNLPSHTQNTLYNILNFVSKIIAIQNWVITLEFIFDDEIFYISNISLEYNADLVNLCLQFGFNINNLLSNILNGNNLTISQLAHNQIAHIPYCYNQEVNNLDFHQDEVIRNNLVNTLNKNYHSGLKQICVQKITDIIYQLIIFIAQNIKSPDCNLQISYC
jgi:hypothetical protein